MKLKSFSIANYRSIRKSEKIQIDNYNVLIGPNNEGKSNILKGLVTALTLAITGDYRQRRAGSGFARRYSVTSDRYNWYRDIPFKMLDDEKAQTKFVLEFELSAAEKGAFKKEIGSTLKTSLSLKLELGSTQQNSSFNIIMPGKANKTFSSNKDKIAAFIKDRIDFQYIPCIRTEELTFQVIEELLQRALENNSGYHKALEKLQQIQNPILQQIQTDALSTIQQFIPEVSSVRIDKNNSYREMGRRPVIQIDDGTLTALEEKGDGIKSLVAISLMRYAATSSPNKNLIILIEEPESHLHPKAVHGLRKVLIDLADKYQLIISSHSQLLIDKLHIENNIVVQKRGAAHAKSIKTIRDVLGVEVSDNLSTASFAILFEGLSDTRIMEKLLLEKSKYFQKLSQQGRVILVPLNGCSKASYQANLYKSLLIEVFLLLDSDTEGIQTWTQLKQKNILDPSEMLRVAVPGMSKAEIEDLIDVTTYSEDIRTKYSVNINTPKFINGRSPWSDRVRSAFQTLGQAWDEEVEKDLKILVADKFVKLGYESIPTYKRPFVDNFIEILDSKFAAIK